MKKIKMNKFITCGEIIREYLEKSGYDGLCAEDGECGCEIDDLMPCGGDYILNCEAGYKKKGDEQADFYIVPGKKGGK